MTSRRVRHALAQFDPRHSLTYWLKYDQRVTMPWWLAVVGYPLVIGSRLVVWAGAMPVAALRNYLSWRTPESGNVVSVVDSPFILVLRTFGHDGDLLLTPEAADQQGLVARAATLEELVGEIGERHSLATIGFADHDLHRIPDGIRYIQVDDARWREQFELLVDEASAIVVMPTPGTTIGESFRSELAYIVGSQRTPSTVVIGPPANDQETRQATYATYRALGWPEVKHVYLVAYEDDDGTMTAIPSLGTGDQALADRYVEAIAKAIAVVAER